MNMSGVEPAERRGHWVTWGLAALGLTAALAAPLALRASTLSAAEQNAAKAATDTAGKPSSVYSIKVSKQTSDRLKLKGQVPTQEDHQALMGLVKASFPSADLTDRVKIADTARDAKPNGIGGISFALKTLSYLQTGEARIDERGVDLSGRTDSNTAYTEVMGFINAPPTGITVRHAQIRPPANALSLRAEVGEGRVILTGAVPDSDGRKKLEASVQRIFPGLEVVNDTYIADGAPESWLNASIHSLHVLRLLDTGFVQLADHTVRLDGHVSDELKLTKIDSLADQYPDGFSFQSKVTAPTQASMLVFPWAAAAVVPDAETPVSPIIGLDHVPDLAGVAVPQ